MASPAQFSRGNGPRKSILELAPLELDCMNTLWPLGEGTVREIQQRLAPSRPRAYTTIMTIMDRLAHKGVVARHKVGRAYLYRPNLTADQARAHAVERVVEGFFEGSAEALAAHLAGEAPTSARVRVRRDVGRVPARKPVEKVDRPSKEPGASPRTRLDEILL
ncbi:MAG: BlaI/MecI/CopY family transcriptional regulator [Candidatus Acidiferrales bacterium]